MKKRIYFILFTVFSLCALAIRLMQEFTLVDIKTGFMSDTPSTVIVYVSIVLALVFAFLYSKEIKNLNLFNYTKSKITVNIILINALLFLMSSVYILTGIDAKKLGYYLVICICGIVSAIFMAYVALYPEKFKNLKLRSILAVAPIVFFVVLLFSTYLDYTMYPNQPSRIFEILFLCSLIFYSLYFGKAVCNFGNRKLLHFISLAVILMFMMSTFVQIVAIPFNVFHFEIVIWKFTLFIGYMALAICTTSQKYFE